MNFLEYLAIFALVGVWGWVLGRPLLMSALNKAHRDPVGHYRQKVAAAGRQAGLGGARPGAVAAGLGGYGNLGPASFRPVLGGRPSLAPRSARKRRLQVMMALGMATAMSALLALVFQGIFVGQLLLLGVLLVAYVGLAAAAGGREADRRHKVTYLNAGRSTSIPARARVASEA